MHWGLKTAKFITPHGEVDTLIDSFLQTVKIDIIEIV